MYRKQKRKSLDIRKGEKQMPLASIQSDRMHQISKMNRTKALIGSMNPNGKTLVWAS
jgi:hypothetical protein